MNRLGSKHNSNSAKAQGFTLLEVMIALVILAIGVMGVIGLQTQTYQQLQTSHNFSKASMLASEMADRMLANEAEAIAGAYTHSSPISKPSPDCAEAVCTSTQLAAYDIWYWQSQLLGKDPDEEAQKAPGSLPKASGEVYVDTGEYIVVVRWDDDLSGSTGTNCKAANPDDDQDPVDDLDCYALNLGCLSEACP